MRRYAKRHAAHIDSQSTVIPNPAQGASETFTATFDNLSAPAGTPVTLAVIGPNLQSILGRTDANGQAIFAYPGIFTGTDLVVAAATVGSQTLVSNQAHITWTAGPHTTFLTLNLSAKSGTVGKSSTLTASLSDLSVSPAIAVSEATLKLALEGNSCTGVTDSKGNATCNLTPTTGGIATLTASFAGTSGLLPATASAGFTVIGPTATPTSLATPTPGPTPLSTPSSTPTLIPTPTQSPTATPSPTQTSTSTATPTPTPTARICVGSTPMPTVPVPTPTPLPGHPVITAIVPGTILVGSSFTIEGRNFTRGSVVNFFVATPTGAINEGPLKIDASSTATKLVVPVPDTVTLGEGFVAVVVINTDESFVGSNPGFALLQGSIAAGLPSITGINSHPLAPTSLDPDYAVDNVETTLLQGNMVTINGNGFDTGHGAAVDVFCACTGGKLPTTFLSPGNPSLKADSISFTLPATTPTGPGSIVVSNAAGGSYSAKSNAVSVPIGARINVTNVTQSGNTLTVDGTGFSTATVINFFANTSIGVQNLGGFGPGGKPNIPLTLINSTRFTFTRPAAALPGLAFVQALNPPFVPFTSSGTDPCGAFPLR